MNHTNQKKINPQPVDFDVYMRTQFPNIVKHTFMWTFVKSVWEDAHINASKHCMQVSSYLSDCDSSPALPEDVSDECYKRIIDQVHSDKRV